MTSSKDLKGGGQPLIFVPVPQGTVYIESSIYT